LTSPTVRALTSLGRAIEARQNSVACRCIVRWPGPVTPALS
jgi:hypothetical protein